MNSTNFEARVANIYRMLGYDVTENVTFSGKKVDIVVKITIPGVGVKILAVDCVDQSKKIGAVYIKDKSAYLLPLIVSRHIDELILVTNIGLTQDAMDLSEKLGIKCIKLGELTAQAFQLDYYLDYIINTYRSGSLAQNYIDLNLCDIELTVENSTLVTPATELINRWLDATVKENLLITGIAGSGKTAICQNTAYVLAQQYHGDLQSTRIPIMITCRDISQNHSVPEALINALRTGIGETVPISRLETLIETGSFLLILDGLDEIHISELPRVINDIQRLSSYGESKILITSRSGYYENITSSNQFSELTDFRIVSIEPLTNSQTRRFLELSLGQKTDLFITLFQTLNRIDFPRYTLLLSMLTLVAPEMYKINTPTVNDIYDMFVSTILERDYYKGRTAPSSLEIIEVLSIIAAAMCNSGRDYLSEIDIHDISLDFDIQTIPLLNRNSSGKYNFTHKSFFEYFLAKSIASGIENGDVSILSHSIVSHETLVFLAGNELSFENLRGLSLSSNIILSENINSLLELCKKTSVNRVPTIRIRRLKLHQIKCFNEATFDFPNKNGLNQITLLIGDNGVGKSTVLQSIALCALGPKLATKLGPMPGKFVRNGTHKGFLCATFEVTGLEADQVTEVTIGLLVNKDSRQFELITKGPYSSKNYKQYLDLRSKIGFKGMFLAGYGPWRCLDSNEGSKSLMNDDQLIDRVQSLFDPTKGLLKPNSLSRLIMGDGSFFAKYGAPKIVPSEARTALIRTLIALLPGDTTETFTMDGDYDGRFGTTQLAELSDGYRSTLAWVGHVAVHLLSTIDWVGSMQDVAGIILVDEIDLHLHPQWQRSIIDRIRRTFPSLQIIASTHSPLVVADAETEDGGAFLLKGFQNEVQVEPNLPSVQGWRIDQILATEIFGHIIDRDPRTERIFGEASMLAGKGTKRTTEEQYRYKEIINIIGKLYVSNAQTQVEREIQAMHRNEVTDEIVQLENELFKD